MPYHDPQCFINYKLLIDGTGGNSHIKGMEMFIVPLRGANDGIRSHLLRSEQNPNTLKLETAVQQNEKRKKRN